MSFGIVKFEIQGLCKHHSLPYAYICNTKYCQCQIKLCQKCYTEHETQNQNSNLMKIQNYFTKIQTQVDILIKQNQSIPQNSKTPAITIQQLKSKILKFIASQVKILDDSTKYLNQQSNKVNKQLNQAFQPLNRKIKDIQIKKKEIPEHFCKKILQTKLLETMITFYSQKGFSNFRKKLDKTLQFRALVKDFLVYAQKFGNKYEQFMKSSSSTASSDLSMKKTMRDFIRLKKGDQNHQNIQLIKNDNRQNKLANQQKVKPKRSKTIFVK